MSFERYDGMIVELGRGLDNTAYAVGDLVLRVADGHAVGREALLLEAVDALVPIAIPQAPVR